MKNYFPHDSDARSDDKIIALRIKHKWEGYGLYWALIEKLRESKHYTLKADYNVLAFDLRADAAILKSVINDFGLLAFTNNGECFYSESLNTRMQPLDEKRAKLSDAGKRGNEKRWKNGSNRSASQSPPDNNSFATQSPPDSHPIAQLSQEEIREEVDNSKPKETSTSVEAKKAEQAKKLAAAKAATLKRRDEFYNSLVPYVERYGKEMIRAFFDYWSELNKSETKMRFETNKTWEVAKRLATWFNKEKFNGKSSSTIPKAGFGSFTKSTGNKAASRETVGQFARAVLEQYKSKDGD